MTHLVWKLLKPDSWTKVNLHSSHYIKVQGQNKFTLLWQSGGISTRVGKLKQLIYWPGCGLPDPGFECQQKLEIFLFSKLSKLVLGPTQPPIQGVLGFFPRGKTVGLEVDHSPASSAEVKNERSYTSTPPICHHGVDRETFTFHTNNMY
jgi:hypothetical protein